MDAKEAGRTRLVSNLLWLCPTRALPLPSDFDVDSQALVLEQLQAVWQAHPPTSGYLTSVLKALGKHSADSGYELSEEWYDLLALASHDAEHTFRTLQLDAGLNVHLRECTALTSHGTTGLRTWGAAVQLTKHLQQHSAIVAGKTVLELGCGTALVTAALLLLPSPPVRVVATDYHPDVLAMARGNLERASSSEDPNSSSEDSNRCSEHPVPWTLEPLDWRVPLGPSLHQTFDVVLAADVVFDPELLPDLLTVLHDALRPSRSSCAIVATTRRNPDTFARWQALLAQHPTLEASMQAVPLDADYVDVHPFDVVLHTLRFRTDNDKL